jgi:1-acyl-sn-glycerol-3-phosphate acyltransferase
MPATSTQLDRSVIRERVFGVTNTLLAELGNARFPEGLHSDAHLERDLSLGSLERVELLVRLGTTFNIQLPDTVVARADTLEDLVTAVAESLHAGPASGVTSSPPVAESLAETSSPAVAPATDRLAEGVPWAETLLDVLRHRARADAARPHLLLYEGDTQVAPVTFGHLYERASAVAHALAARGIAPGERVALMLPTSLEFFYCFAGTMLAGAVPVPIYPPFRADHIAEYAARQSAILASAGVRLLITFERAATVARLLAPKVPTLSGVVEASQLVSEKTEPLSPGALPVAPAMRRADDLAFLQYTSGSTGDPKGVMLTHANLLANIRAIGHSVGVLNSDVGTSWLPLYHDMGLIGAWMVPLYFGLPVAILSPLDFLTRPARWLRMIHRHRGTLAAAPNFAYELCARKISDSEIEGLDVSSWRVALNGAETIQPETMERFATRFAAFGFNPEALLPVYGLAETALALSMPPLGRAPRIDAVERETFELEGRAVPVMTPAESATQANGHSPIPNAIRFVSVGSPVQGHEVRIVTAAGADAGERLEGALWFRGPSATRGYYNNPAATAELFPEGSKSASDKNWLNSGDRAYWAEGELFITGRAKDIIIKAGRNLYPHEVESLAARADGVRKGCVVAFGADGGAKGSSTGTERLVVAAEVRDSSLLRDASRRNALAQQISQEISAGLSVPPDAVELLAPGSIPKTSSGKLRRAETRRLYLNGGLGRAVSASWVQIARLAVSGAIQRIGQVLARAAEVVYGIYALAVFAACLLPAWILLQLTFTRSAAASIATTALRIYFFLIGLRIRVEGRGHLAGNSPNILVSNHTSYADVLILVAALGVDYRFVSKSEIARMPFVATFLGKLGHLVFDRSSTQARLAEAAEIENMLRSGNSVFIFPEGTFTRNDGVRPFQLGAFKAAVDTHLPIVPIALRGTRRLLRDGTWLPRPTRVSVTILPPMVPSPATSGNEWHEIVHLKDAARAVIAEHSGELPL